MCRRVLYLTQLYQKRCSLTAENTVGLVRHSMQRLFISASERYNWLFGNRYLFMSQPQSI